MDNYKTIISNIIEYRNYEHGINAQVFERFYNGTAKYGVRVFDSEACEFVPSIKFFASVEDAKTYAKRCL